MNFIKKLNRHKAPHVIADEVLILTEGKWAGFLQHDNVNEKSIVIYTQPERQGSQILGYVAEHRENLEWRLWLRVNSNEPQLYLSYESFGDTVEAEDMNELQQSVQSLDVALRLEEARTNAHHEHRGNPHVVTKVQVGLGLADDTADIDKPVSTAQQAALTEVADAAATALKNHSDRVDNPHTVTKAQVGLGEADNTSDINKPVSTAQRSAIDKAATDAATALKSHTDRANNPHTVTKAQVGLGVADNTADIDKPVSTAQRAGIDKAAVDAAIALKAHTDSTNNPHTVAKAQVGLGSVDNIKQATKAEFDIHNTDQTRHLTPSERTVWNDRYTRNEVDNKLAALEMATDWKESVATLSSLSTTYPNPQDGWTVNVKDTNYTYRWDGTAWVPISANAIPKATQSVDGLLSKEDKMVLDDAGNKRHVHGNKSVLDGLTAALITAWNEAVIHISDAVKHITAAERTAWNAKETPVGAQNKADGAKAIAISTASTDATAKANQAEVNAKTASVPTGRKINGKPLSADVTLISTDTGSATLVHAHTAAQAGLGNVPNVGTNDQTPTFTAATARANLTSGEKLTLTLGKLAKWFADLKPVAWSGSYTDLINTPTIPSVPGTLPPNGAAGGALSGTYPNPTVKDDSHTHSELTVKPDNYRDGVALPSTYPRGMTIFLSDEPINKFNGVFYCTVVTIKGYTNMPCVQYLYPYNVDAPIVYRYAIYNSDTWKEWRSLSIDGHTHSWSTTTGKPATFPATAHNHDTANMTSGTLPIARGGTGATTAAAALAALNGATVGHGHTAESVGAEPDLTVVTSKATPVDADGVILLDSAVSNSTKKILWSTAKSTLKTHFDTLYNKYVHPAYTARTVGLYKVTVDSVGHVSAATAVAKSDITALGIPAQDTVYGLPAATSSVLGGVKIGAGLTLLSGTISASAATVGAAPASHPHTKAQITDFPTSLPANGGTATYASMLDGMYTANGGKQAPSYVPSGRLRFNMMNTLGHYADWLLMDSYGGGDVPFVTAFGVEKTATPAAWVMVGPKGGDAWSASRRVALFTGIPTSGSVVVSDGTVGGVKTTGGLTWDQLKGV